MYETHGLDTQDRVFFYEQDFYVLSNFSSFTVRYHGALFPTAEHLYHWLKYVGETTSHVEARIKTLCAHSAHEAFRLSQDYVHLRRPDWDAVKVDLMRTILFLKVEQHEYVRRKLLATGDRELVENSWRDDFWGWGAEETGQNILGKLWMEVRSELRKTR